VCVVNRIVRTKAEKIYGGERMGRGKREDRGEEIGRGQGSGTGKTGSPEPEDDGLFRSPLSSFPVPVPLPLPDFCYRLLRERRAGLGAAGAVGGGAGGSLACSKNRNWLRTGV
jgi:hypothetical protein